MANTTNYNWETPDDTDLLKDGAAAIRTLGNSIDTTTKNLNPETTTGDIAYRSATSNINTRLGIGSAGQVLTVVSGVPSWATPNVGDITEVQAGTGISVASGTGPIPIVTNTVATAFDAAGDLVYGTGADTFTKLSIGTVGQVLTVNSGATAPEWTTPAASASGLTLISTTTIGNGVSSVTVTGAFSSTYDNYRIIVSGGVSSTSNGGILKLGTTTTGYEQTEWTTSNASSSVAVSSSSNTQGFNATKSSVNSHIGIMDILSPFLSKYTSFYGWTQRSVSTFSTQINHGTLTNTTSYTAFTLTPDAGTFTGGTIKVYGYQN